MEQFGIEDMRRQASELVRRAGAGETLVIAVAGRPTAILGPVAPKAWRTWDEVCDVFAGPVDPCWADDRDVLDHSGRDLWAAE